MVLQEELQNEIGISFFSILESIWMLFLKSVVQACADNESVRLADFRIFTVRVMAERKGRNPQTGEVMNLPSRRAVRFIPASDFRHKIEG